MANKSAIPACMGRFLLLGALLATTGTAWAAVAGNVQFVLGEVRIRAADGAERAAEKGAAVNVGDRLITGSTGTAQLRMIDNAFIAVRPDSEMEIKVYQFVNSQDTSESAVLSLVRGTMRAFTGAISRVRKERFSMITPTATIGVRGSGNVAHYSPALGTINHTIEGAHGVQSLNLQGQPVGGVFVTRPGVTVQVLPGQAPTRIPMPAIIREAVQQPRQQAQQGQGQGQGQRQGQGQGQGQRQQGQQQAGSGGGTSQGGGEGGSTQAAGGTSSGGGSTDSSGGGTASSGTGDSPRVSSSTDSGLTATTLSSTPTAGSTSFTNTPPPPTTTTITGSTSSGGSLNLATQVQTTSTGQITNLVAGLPPNPVAASTGNFRALALYPIPGTGGTNFLGVDGFLNSTSATMANTGLTQDASGNLLRIVGEDWNAFNGFTATQCASNAPCLTTAGAATTGTDFSMTASTVGSSGTSFNSNGDFASSSALERFNSGTGGVFGRYVGGTVTVKDPVTGNTLVTPLGSNSVDWGYFEVPSVLATSLSGVYHYLPTAATAPVDSLGHVGTLFNAALGVNFGNQSVDAGLRLGINGQDIRAFAPGIALASNFFFTASTSNGQLHLFCYGTNCAPLPVGASQPINTNSGYFGSITGSLIGNTASAAFFRYIFGTAYNPTVAVGASGGIPVSAPAGTVANNYIDGFVGFGQGPAVPLVAPAAFGKQVRLSYAFVNNGNVITASRSSGGFDKISSFAGKFGNLDSILPGPSNPGSETFTVNNAANLTFAATPTTLANGISFGSYQGNNFYGVGPAGQALTVSGSDNLGTFTNRLVQGGLQWIAGPQTWPVFTSNVLTGSVSYTGFTASQPGDLSGTLYAASTVSSSLSVNLSNQSANTSVSVNLPASGNGTGSGARNWVASASSIALDDGGGFSACTNCAGSLAHRSMSLSLNGSSVSTFGNINGQLTGPLLNGAMLTYSFGGTDILNSNKTEGVAGVVGFTNPSYNITPPTGSALPTSAIDPLAPFQLLLRARGVVAGFDATSVAPNVVTSSIPAASIDDQYLTRTAITALNPARTQINSLGQLTQFDQMGVVVTANPCSPGTCSPNTNEIPVTVSLNIAPITPPPGSTAPAILDTGSDMVTGIRWGRYSGGPGGGTVAFIDRITGAVMTAGINAGSINHYLLGPVQNGATTLPTTGSATYTMVGNTSPTDNLNNVGTLNSATLSADFSSQKVNAAIGATVNGITWNASTQSGGVPIIAGVAFEASKPLNGTGTLNVSCSGGSCNNTAANLAGRVTGAFTGATGQGAGVAYSLFNGTVNQNVSVTGTSVGGVVAFKR